MEEKKLEYMEIPRYSCLRCGHTWISRISTIPKRCPKCTSPYWNKPRTRKKKED